MDNFQIAIGIVKKDKKYLIGKRALKKKFSPGKWEFISGFVELNEKPEKTIIRELKEETGLIGKVIKKGDSYFITDEEGKWTMFPFLIEVKNDNFKKNKKDHEELKWVEIKELNKYEDLISDIVHLKKDILKTK